MKETRAVDIPLTEEEVIDAGKSLARLAIEIANLKAQKSATAKDFDAQIKALESDQQPLIQQLTSCMRSESVECEWKVDFETMIKTLVSPHGVILDTRPISERERQTSIEDEIRKLSKPQSPKPPSDDDNYPSIDGKQQGGEG